MSKKINQKKEGVRFNEGKLQWGLLPSMPMVLIVRVLMFGMSKGYAKWNWTLGMSYTSQYEAAKRHLEKWFFEGKTYDEESGLHHLAHAMCDMMFILFYECYKGKYKKYDDRYIAQNFPVKDSENYVIQKIKSEEK